VNISATFIRKPIATAMLMVAILLLGLISYELLPVAALPNIDSPTVQVTAQLPGADAQTVVGTVTTPLERQFGQIPGLTQMTSSRAAELRTGVVSTASFTAKMSPGREIKRRSPSPQCRAASGKAL
jgi:multidrug efflux pump subunit AcrB